MANTDIGFIGLGRMGGAMAAHLLAAAVPLFVFDAREEAVEPRLVRGATIVSNPAKLADSGNGNRWSFPSSPMKWYAPV